MAIDQTDVALNIASKTVTSAANLLDAIAELEALEAQRVAAGITLPDFDADYATSGVKHVNGASLNAVLNTSIPLIWTYITTNNHDDNLEKMRA